MRSSVGGPRGLPSRPRRALASLGETSLVALVLTVALPAAPGDVATGRSQGGGLSRPRLETSAGRPAYTPASGRQGRSRLRFTPYFVGGQVGTRAPGAVEAEAAPTPPRRRLQARPGEDPRATLVRVQRALQRAPGRADLHVLHGDTLAALQRPREARKAYEEALRLDVEAAGAELALGRLLVEAGLDPRRGAEILRGRLEVPGEQVPALVGLGIAAHREKRYPEARQLLEKAAQADPASVDARYQLGLTLLRLGSRSQALHAFREVTALDPVNTRAWVSQGVVLAEFGERDAALAALARAWHLMRGEGPAAKGIEQRMRDLDPYADPRRMKVSVPRPRAPPAARPPVRPPVDAPANPGAEVARPGAGAAPGPVAAAPTPPPSRLDPAIPPALDLRAPPPGAPDTRGRPKALAGPDSAGRLARMAGLYRGAGLYDEAAALEQARVARDPTSAAAREAMQALEEMADLPRPSTHERLDRLRRLAGRLEARRDRRGAQDALERLVLIEPTDAVAWKDLAVLATRADQLDLARQRIEKALDLQPGMAEALLVKAYVLARERKFAQALVVYRGILEGDDADPRARRYAETMERTLGIFAQ